MTACIRRAGALALALSLIAPPTWAGSFAKPAKKRSQAQVTGKLESAARVRLPAAAATEQRPTSLPAVQRLPGMHAQPGFGPAATPAPARKRPGRNKVTPRKEAPPQGFARPQIDRFSPIKPAAADKPGAGVKPAGALGPVSERPTRDADGNFRFGNGQGVPGSDPQGRPGKIAADGSIHYPDGTRVTHDPVSGDTKATRPGQASTVWRGTRRDDSGAFRFNDGTRVPGTDGDGNPGKIGSDGSISYPDGTRITHDPIGGDTKAVGPNGVTVWHRGDGAADGEFTPGGFGPAGDEAAGHGTTWNDEQGAFDFGDGYGAPARDANGSLGKINGDGTVGYADGTLFDHDRGTGDTKIHRSDGSVDVWRGNDARYGGGGGHGGTRYNDDQGAFDFGDGYGAPATDASGTPGKINSDGTISYSDGTWVSHDTESGDTKVVRPDGSVDVYTGNDDRYGSDGSSSEDTSSSSSSSSDSSSSDSSSNDTSSDSDSSSSDSDSDSSSDSDADADSSDTDAATDKPASEDTKGAKGYTPGPGWGGGETGTNQDSDKRWLENMDIVGNPGPNGGVAGGDPNANPEPVPLSVGPGANPGDGQWAPSPWQTGPPLPGSEGVLINPNPVDPPETGGDGPPPGLPEPPVHTR